MANEGNTGQRWKLSNIVDSTIGPDAGNTSILRLSCEHEIRVTHKSYEDAMWSMEYDHQRIGRKQRWPECRPEE